jgi:predicted alpha-1,2-mannosidase
MQARARAYFTGMIVVALAAGIPAARSAPAPQSADPTGYVNPFIGTNPAPTSHYGFGFDTGDVFPGAVAPNGMVAWSPDTTTNIPGGYWYPDTAIKGFSLTHFSGRGCSYEGDVPFMPVAGPVTTSPGGNPSAYNASFSHANETASPGYYHVALDSGVGVSLAATTRTGIGQFTYPAEPTSSMTINPGGSVNGVSAAQVNIDPATQTVTGSATTTVGCGSDRYTIYFASQFDQPFSSYGTWNGSTLQPGSTSAAGSRTGAYLSFDTGTNQTVQAKTAISYVSIAGAQANLTAEDPGWSLDAIRDATNESWNAVLHRIEVTGGTDTELTNFYTAMYHLFIEPGVFNDVDGRYIGFDNQIHTVDPGHTQYDNITGWDAYRSFISLFAALEPDVTSDIIRSLLNDAAQGGPGLARWEQINRNSAGNVGDDPDPFVANAYAYGARDFDAAAALHAMDLGASDPTTRSGGHLVREQDGAWLGDHFVPGSPGNTQEYATDDFSIAAFARALGQTDLADRYQRSAQNWQYDFNPASGFVQPKQANGEFTPGFTPTSENGFMEGDAYQYTPMVPFNLGGLINAMGGPSAYSRYLDALTSQLNGGPSSMFLYQGNEPSEEIAWQYDYTGQPYKTQAVVRNIQTQLFTDTPGGIPGNDDGGAMSSWYIWSVLGMYPETPGTGELVVGSPMFPHTVVHLGNGNTITINAPQAAPDAPYVQGLRLDGTGWPHTYLPPSFALSGGVLDYTLDTTPNTDWATGPGAAPSSYSQDEAPAIGFTNTGEIISQPGQSSTLTVGAQNVTGSPEKVTWTASAPDGVSVTTSSQPLVVPPAGRDSQAVIITAGSVDGIYPVTLHFSAAGTPLPDVVVDVAVARPGDLAPYFDNTGVSDDADQGAANYDGSGFSYSAEALAAAGLTPGATVSADGISYSWPEAQPGEPDNVVAAGQVIPLPDHPGAAAVGVLGSATNAGATGSTGTGVLTFTDGSTQQVTLSYTDWTLNGNRGTVQFGNTVVARMPYRNSVGGTSQSRVTYVFSATTPIPSGKTVSTLTLPASVSAGSFHVFAVGIG